VADFLCYPFPGLFETKVLAPAQNIAGHIDPEFVRPVVEKSQRRMMPRLAPLVLAAKEKMNFHSMVEPP
jgi:hypothetical protein